MNPELIVKSALDIGEAMLKSGAETVRVEDTITRICRSYYSGHVDVTSYLSAIFVSLEITEWTETSPFPRIVSQHRRVTSVNNDLQKLEELNALSRYVCVHRPEPEEIDSRLRQILSVVPNPRVTMAGYALIAVGFTVFFGGSLLDAFCCGFIALVIYCLEKHIRLRSNNELIHTFVLSFFYGLPACLMQLSPLPVHLDKIMIGNVMLLIPGLALTNSLRDLFTGDILSGSLKLLNSLLLAIAIAFGFALSMIITGV